LLRSDKTGAAEELLKYTKGGGKVLPGLVKRRQDEQALFLSPQ
jgi:lysozyme